MLSNTFENEVLLNWFNNSNIANVGDATGIRGSTTAGSLYAALHSADPGEAGDQTASEVGYTGYARVAIARSSGGFTVTNNEVVTAATTTFGQRTDAASTDVVFVSLGVASSGASKILTRHFCGTITDRLVFTATTADVITIPGNVLAVNDRCVFMADVVGAALPTGISAGTIYFVKTVSTNDITISTTQGGATLDITAVGAGFIAKVVPLTVAQNVTPQIAAGALKYRLD